MSPDDVIAAQSKRFAERMSGLSPPELEAARMVLEHLADRVEAEHAPFQSRLPNRPREALASWALRSG